MIGNALRDKLKQIKHGEWLLALLVLSVALALLSSGSGTNDTASDMEKRLSQVLSRIEGAGNVEVALYYEETVRDVWNSETKNSALTGALIVAQGASDAAVRLRLMRAVSTLLSLDASRVEIFGMEK